MKVADVMTRDVATVETSTPLRDVAAILAGRRISGVPVIAEGRVVGVVSEADILIKERGEPSVRGGLFGFLLEDRAEAVLKLEATTAGEAMTSPAVTIAPNRSLSEAAETMIEENVNRLPVVDEDGLLVGIVTRADLVRAFVRSDDEIAKEIRDEVLLRTLWIPPGNVSVTVEKGAVTLVGEVETAAVAEMLPRLVQRVPGVVSVSPLITWARDDGRRAVPSLS